MRSSLSGRRGQAASSLRRGVATRQLLVGSALAAACGAALWMWFASPWAGRTAIDPGLVQRVVRGPFEHDVSERGELESSNNVLIRCEVQSRTAGTNGVKIIEIVPEGTVVKKGDLLVRFDEAALQAERTTQLINVGSAEATAAQSQNDLTAAIIARKEYEFGEFETEREKFNGEILVASQAVSHAEEALAHTKKLLRRGYVSRLQMQSEEFRLAKAESDLRAGKVKLNALVEFTKPKKLSELDSKVKTSEAKLKSDEAKLALENQKLRVLDEQIAKCTVLAPTDGQVIYDHERDDWGGGENQIKQGTVVHEQRVVARLPDPRKMQVVAKVAESRIDRIKVGMPAKIEIEGLPGVQLQGKVTRVNEYPAPDDWFSGGAKDYATTVEVIDSPVGLRPGMTARVAIRVETIADALQVPIQAVVEKTGKYYCLRKADGILEPRQVLVGSTNEKFLVVRQGLEVDDEVVLNPRGRLAEVDLDELTLVAGASEAGDARQAGVTHGPVARAAGGAGL